MGNCRWQIPEFLNAQVPASFVSLHFCVINDSFYVVPKTETANNWKRTADLWYWTEPLLPTLPQPYAIAIPPFLAFPFAGIRTGSSSSLSDRFNLKNNLCCNWKYQNDFLLQSRYIRFPRIEFQPKIRCDPVQCDQTICWPFTTLKICPKTLQLKV